MTTENGTGHPQDEWPPTETVESRMTGEGSPPPPDEEDKTAENGPEFAETDGAEDDG
ncbi:hypothetical protein [Kitasatospora terrestris]|uniref:Uncharacterized protein n=1 Tax=Kitasatospora terrestris TaxID=258051 RepID=A0ABP9EY08_9ACTN